MQEMPTNTALLRMALGARGSLGHSLYFPRRPVRPSPPAGGWLSIYALIL